MTFARLRPVDWAALIAALALLLLSSADWYGTARGDRARTVEENSNSASSGEGGVVERTVNQDAREIAESQEKNAWQAGALIDRLILIALIATVCLAVAAAYGRASGRRFEPPRTPSGAAAIAALVTASLVVYRIIQEPGLDSESRIKAGAPLAVAALTLLAIASARGLRNEEADDAFRELPPEPKPTAAAPPRPAE